MLNLIVKFCPAEGLHKNLSVSFETCYTTSAAKYVVLEGYIHIINSYIIPFYQHIRLKSPVMQQNI